MTGDGAKGGEGDSVRLDSRDKVIFVVRCRVDR